MCIRDSTSDLLTRLTDWTAVVMSPTVDQATVRRVQLVDLSSHVAMVVAVMSNGVVEKRTVEVAAELTPEIVEDAGRRLTTKVEGRTLVELAAGTVGGGDADGADPLLDAAITALGEAGRQAELYVGGASRLAGAFDAVEQVPKRRARRQIAFVGHGASHRRPHGHRRLIIHVLRGV